MDADKYLIIVQKVTDNHHVLWVSALTHQQIFYIVLHIMFFMFLIKRTDIRPPA